MESIIILTFTHLLVHTFITAQIPNTKHHPGKIIKWASFMGRRDTNNLIIAWGRTKCTWDIKVPATAEGSEHRVMDDDRRDWGRWYRGGGRTGISMGEGEWAGDRHDFRSA